MRYGFAADLHLDNFALGRGQVVAGVSERLALGCATLLKVAEHCDVLVIAGDVFHVANPTPQVVAAVMGAMETVCTFGGVQEIHIIKGNHDMVADDAGNHALMPLRFLPNVYVHEEPEVVDVCGLSVFMASFPANPTQLTCDGADVCVAHHGIYDRETPEFLKESGTFWKDIRTWCNEQGVEWYLAGDWHPHRRWERGRVTQIGTLIPATFSDSGIDDKGTLVVLEGDPKKGASSLRQTVVNIPGPRFMEVPGKQFAPDLAKDLMAQGHTPFIAYPLEDGAMDVEVPGAVFKPVPRRSVKEVDNTTREEALEVLATTGAEEVLDAYLRWRYPTRASRMLTTILKYMGAT